MRMLTRGALGTVSLGIVLSACGGGSGSGAVTRLTGAGATFPNPIYAAWFDSYARTTGIQINYQSIGSGGGIRQFTEGTVHFGATDGPMTEEQITAVSGNVVHVPTVLGAVVLTYNLPDVGATTLVLDAATIADIFLGTITRWNDPRLVALNPEVTLPDRDITVVHRSDGSGTTFVFVDYLSKVSPVWSETVGRATAVSWPLGIGGKGNEGVTQQVRQLEGAIGYVEYVYAVSNGLPAARVVNQAGTPVSPSLESVTAAAASADFPPDTDFRVSITNPPGADAYPIASFTWLLVKRDNPDPAVAATLRDFLSWMITPEAQAMATKLQYSPLPEPVVALVRERIGTLQANGAPIG